MKFYPEYAWVTTPAMMCVPPLMRAARADDSTRARAAPSLRGTSRETARGAAADGPSSVGEASRQRGSPSVERRTRRGSG